MAGPKRPQDRISLPELKAEFLGALDKPVAENGFGKKGAEDAHATVTLNGTHPAIDVQINHGSVLIAAITSCTNTSNPSVMLAAGLLAKKAVERGLTVNRAVKTSLAPGSRVVTDYLDKTGLQPYLDKLGFELVGYGCTTCIGNSGPLNPIIDEAITKSDLVAASVLSGNRNFEARVHPSIKANFLMSPPLVVAFALAGKVDIDLVHDPLGTGKDGKPVYLKDIWPTLQEIKTEMEGALKPEIFRKLYSNFAEQNPAWNNIPGSTGETYAWNEASTYIQEPPFFDNFSLEPGHITEIVDARPLGIFGDSVPPTTSRPAGSFKKNSPAGVYLLEQGVKPEEFNSYGARRGNDRVMTRGTFANVRIKNLMVPGVEGGVTKFQPTGEQMSIYDASLLYQEKHVPLVIIAGQEYGTGSSRDWGGEGDEASRCQGGHRAKLRAHPPQQSRRHGRASALLCRWRQRADPQARRHRDLLVAWPDRRHQTASDGEPRKSGAPTARSRPCRSSCASTRPSKSTTTSTAGFFPTSCGRSSGRRRKPYAAGRLNLFFFGRGGRGAIDAASDGGAANDAAPAVARFADQSNHSQDEISPKPDVFVADVGVDVERDQKPREKKPQEKIAKDRKCIGRVGPDSQPRQEERKAWKEEPYHQQPKGNVTGGKKCGIHS